MTSGAVSDQGLLLKSSETFRAYFGCQNFLYILATTRFSAIKMRNLLVFFLMKNMLNDHLFKTRKLQSDNGLFPPENFSGLSRNGPLTRQTSYQYQVSFKVHLAPKHFFR